MVYHQDSDTLSLPLDLLSPPLESESSTALVDSESLPAPPQFGSNKDDTDIEEDVTPKGDEMTPDSLDLVTTQLQIGKPFESQTTIEEFNALAKSGLKPPSVQKQESNYESRAEKMLESQSLTTVTTVDSFTDEQVSHRDNNTIEIVDLDRELQMDKTINGKKTENLLLKALDTFDSFSVSNEFPITRRQDSMTYEDSANDMLERQTTAVHCVCQKKSLSLILFFSPDLEYGHDFVIIKETSCGNVLLWGNSLKSKRVFRLSN